MDTLAFGYILPTTGRIRDFNPLETCAARRTYKTERCNLMLHRSVFIEMSGSVICGISFCNSFLQVLHPLRRMQLFLLHTEGSELRRLYPPRRLRLHLRLLLHLHRGL